MVFFMMSLRWMYWMIVGGLAQISQRQFTFLICLRSSSLRVQKRFSLFMLGHSTYVDDVFEDDVSPVMVMEIHLFQETLGVYLEYTLCHSRVDSGRGCMVDRLRWKPIFRAYQRGSTKEVLCLRPWSQDGWPSFRLASYFITSIYQTVASPLSFAWYVIALFLSYSFDYHFYTRVGAL